MEKGKRANLLSFPSNGDRLPFRPSSRRLIPPFVRTKQWTSKAQVSEKYTTQKQSSYIGDNI